MEDHIRQRIADNNAYWRPLSLRCVGGPWHNQHQKFEQITISLMGGRYTLKPLVSMEGTPYVEYAWHPFEDPMFGYGTLGCTCGPGCRLPCDGTCGCEYHRGYFKWRHSGNEQNA